MSPSDLLLAKQECSQLLQQGLIEPIDSDWACQAFYVEKISELVRGKKRLVIDYQPLNSFLKDDKFPLPKIQTLFVHLQGARIFSKLDLKAGFWQLGISPVDHHKTAFCIPDAHYQWTVMPFGLKEHGIMLSEKKSSRAKESIDFLGMGRQDTLQMRNYEWEVSLLDQFELLVEIFDVGVCSAPWSWIWTLRVVGRKVPTTACWYCLNLVPRRAILAITGCPCWEDIEEYDDEPKRRKHKSKKIIYPACRYHAAHPEEPPEFDSQAPLPIYHKVTPDGHLEEPHSFEAVLNWQTQNAVAQNQALTTLHHKVDNITHKTNQVEKKVDTISDKLNQIYQNLHNRVTQLNSELRAMLAQRVYSPDFDKNKKKKKLRLRALKAEIARIDSEKVQPTLFTSSAPLPVINPTYHPFLPSTSSRTYEPSRLFDSSIENFPSRSDSSSIESSDLSESDTSDSNLADISKLLMAEPTEQSGATNTRPRTELVDTDEENHETGESSQSVPLPPKVSKLSNGSWFTFDDIPTTKWRERLQALSAWIDLQMLAPDATTQSALALLHDQFIREPSATFEAAKRDYLNMKCCSLNTKDLHYHYKQMSLIYYKLNGFNDIAMGCLDKLCEQKNFSQDLIKDKEPFRSACKKPWLSSAKIQKDVIVHQRKSLISRNPDSHFHPGNGVLNDFAFSRKKQSHSKDFPNRKKNRCVISKMKGHFAKDCPVKPQKAIKLIQHLESTIKFSPTTDQVEHLFSEQKEPNNDTVFALPAESNDSDSSDFEPVYTVQPSSILIHDHTIPIPSVKIQIVPSRYHKPITAIGFLDTGAQRSMLNYAILPTEYWETQEEHFKAADGKIFTTKLVTKHPIRIQLFPNCVVWIKLIGSALPNKDLLVGTHDEHHKLLQQFFQIIQEHGIMISNKKSTIATTFVDFLDLKIQDGHYQPGPHIAQELLHFLESNFTKKQVLQFLGIINYIRDFLPHVNHHTSKLSALLKKNPPSWSDIHTDAVKQLKQIAQNPPPLKLITNEKRILQTDASDESWGAILLEECNGKEHFIAYASGQFPNAQKHYHIVYKKILAVKNGIKKFEFHLIGHRFLIRLDNSAFSNILNFKQKISFLIIAMASSLPKTALTQKSFPLNMTFQSPHSIQDFARKFLFRKLQQIADTHRLLELPDQEGKQFTSALIIQRPYFQHPHTKDFWTQNQSYEWTTVPHIACLEQDFQIKTSLKNFLMELNHIPLDQPDILHTFLGPKLEMFMIPTPSLHSQPPNHGIIIKEEKPDHTDFLFQDSQDPYEDFTPVPSPSPYELYGSSSSPYPSFSTQLEHFPQPTPLSPNTRDCLWPCVLGCSHPEKIFKKDKDPNRDPNKTDSSSSEDASISL
ncbi:hypothetical protein KPL70_025939 [Citrus sinensis]|nr:hypothetical protein KPL70_025939 [Citrus sinensis]